MNNGIYKPKEPKDIIWTTEKGEKLKLKDIKTNHLQNIVKMLKRKGATEKTIKIFNQELRLRKLNEINNNPDYKELF